MKEAQPRKSFSESIVEKVGGLVRSKSLKTKAPTRQNTDDPGLTRRPSTRSQNHQSHRPRLSLSLARAKLTARANTEPILSTSTSGTSPAPITLPPPPPQPESDSNTSKSNVPPELTNLIPAPLRPRSPSRSRSRSRSRSNSKQPASSRKDTEIDMDENGIMVVDGVEFVNVISVQARVDAATATATKPPRTAATPFAVSQQPRERERHQQPPQQGPPRQQQRRNQGYTRGSVGLDLLTDRSTAAVRARLAATSTPKIGTGEALGIVSGNTHQKHHHLHQHQHGGFESSMVLATTAPAISSH
jgi:hypothetical protein